MKHKTWFRLVLRAIGIFLIGLGIPNAIQSAAWVLVLFDRSGSYGSLSMVIGYIAAPAAQIAIGLYLLLGGKWILDRIIPSNRPYCPDCGYDLSHNTGPKCTECGVTLPLGDCDS